MWGCSLRVSTLLGGDEALAWHAPGGVLRPPYQWRRLSLRARIPEQHSAQNLSVNTAMIAWLGGGGGGGGGGFAVAMAVAAAVVPPVALAPLSPPRCGRRWQGRPRSARTARSPCR